jgi:hypothetical protein
MHKTVVNIFPPTFPTMSSFSLHPEVMMVWCYEKNNMYIQCKKETELRKKRKKKHATSKQQIIRDQS